MYKVTPKKEKLANKSVRNWYDLYV